MTDSNSTEAAPPNLGADEPAELDRFLSAYRPTGVAPSTWAAIAEPAAALVLRAGAPTRRRVEKDSHLLGSVVAHLVDRGRPVSLDEALSDATFLSFDSSLHVSIKTRENKRGIVRRLQAVHRGLPWRRERRAYGERVQQLIPFTQVTEMRRVLAEARLIVDDDPDAAAFVAAVTAAHASRGAAPQKPDVDVPTWTRARRFASRHGWPITKVLLRGAVTHEVLDGSDPVAVLIARHALTRRDLELALTRVGDSGNAPGQGYHDLLRGAS